MYAVTLILRNDTRLIEYYERRMLCLIMERELQVVSFNAMGKKRKGNKSDIRGNKYTDLIFTKICLESK